MQTIPARSISTHPSGGTGLHPSGGTGLLTLETSVLTSTKDETRKIYSAAANNTCTNYQDTSVLTSMKDEAQKIFSAEANKQSIPARYTPAWKKKKKIDKKTRSTFSAAENPRPGSQKKEKKPQLHIHNTYL